MFALDEPLINLGLAQYGFNSEIIEKLYIKGDKALKLAALMNRAECYHAVDSWNSSWMRDDLINQVIYSDNENEKYALLTNPLIGSGILTALFKKGSSFGINFESLTEINWRILLTYAGDNALLKTLHDSSCDDDGLGDFLYSDMFREAWKLVDSVPITKEWSQVLWMLLRFSCFDNEIDPMKSYVRWQSLGKESADIRTVLARLLNNEDLIKLNDDDIKNRILEERLDELRMKDETKMEQREISHNSGSIKQVLMDLKSMQRLIYLIFMSVIGIAIYLFLK